MQPARTCSPRSMRPPVSCRPTFRARRTIRKVNPADSPIMIISLTSDTLPLATVDDYAENIVLSQVSRIDGVGQAFIGGQQKPAVRIQIDPRQARGHGPADRRGATAHRQRDRQRTRRARSTAPRRRRQSTPTTRSWTSRPGTTWSSATTTARPSASRDIGQAVQSVENDQVGAWVYPGPANNDPTLKGGRAVLLIIFKQPGANVIQTVNRIKAALPGLKADIPPAIDMHIVADRTQTIRASVRDVEAHAADHRRPGGGRDLPVPARRARDADPQRRHPALAAGHDGGDAGGRTSASTTCR